LRVVTVVGGEQRSAELAGDVQQRPEDAHVVVLTVVLELDEEVVAAEDVLEARRGLDRGAFVAREDQLRDEPAETAGRGGYARVVAFEQLPVAARLVVVAVEVRAARELDEVAVALV